MSSQMLKTVAIKNNMHYSKQDTADATHVTAALASLGQKTSRSLLFSRIIGTEQVYSVRQELNNLLFLGGCEVCRPSLKRGRQSHETNKACCTMTH